LLYITDGQPAPQVLEVYLHGIPAAAKTVPDAEALLRRCVRTRNRARPASARLPCAAWEVQQAAAAIAVHGSDLDKALALLHRAGQSHDGCLQDANEDAGLLAFSRWYALPELLQR